MLKLFKIQILVILSLAISISIAKDNSTTSIEYIDATNNFKEIVNDNSSYSYDHILNSIQQASDSNFWATVFVNLRSYWTGFVIAYNNYTIDYEIGDWCMNTDFQTKFAAGVSKGITKLLTLQYINIFQYANDIVTAYNFMTSQFYYCKGNGISEDTYQFVFNTFFWTEVYAVFISIITSPFEFIAAIPLSLFNLFSGNIKSLGYISKFFK